MTDTQKDPAPKRLPRSREARLIADASAPPAAEPAPQELLKAAVSAAEKAASETKPETPAPAPAVVKTPEPTAQRPAVPYLAYAAGVALALGLGGIGGWGMASARSQAALSPAQQAIQAIDWTALAASVRQNQNDLAQIGGEIGSLKGGLAGLKEGIEKAKQESGTRLAQVGGQLDRASKADQDIGAKISALAERLERLDRDHGAKIAPIAERLERIERQAAPTKAAAAPVADPVQTASLPEQKPKPAVIEGWVIREVSNGLALVEDRNQRLLEIGPGENLPGVGRVEAIERRGKSWVLVTPKGLITSQQW